MKKISVSPTLFTAAALLAGANTAHAATQTQEQAAQCLFIGGAANVVYTGPTEGIAAMTGTIDGGAYARVVSEREDVGNDRVEFDMEHFFIHEDGSTIFTNDRSFLQFGANGEITGGGTDYTVVASSGRFEGYRGIFSSRGGWLLDRGVGALRFEGKICK